MHKSMNKNVQRCCYLCRQYVSLNRCALLTWNVLSAWVYMYLSGLRREVCVWKIHYYSDCPCICEGLIFIFFFPLPLLLICSSTFICGMARKFNKAQSWYCSFCLSGRRKSCSQNFMVKKWKENTLQWQNKNVQQVRLQLMYESCASDMLPKDEIPVTKHS